MRKYYVLLFILLIKCDLSYSQLEHFFIGIYSYDHDNAPVGGGYSAGTDPIICNDTAFYKIFKEHNFNCIQVEYQLTGRKGSDPMNPYPNAQYAASFPSKDFLDRAELMGMKVMLSCPDLSVYTLDDHYNANKSTNGLNYYGDHPALWGFHVKDEPLYNLNLFNDIGLYFFDIENYNNKLLRFVNLLPMWGTNIPEDYEDYIQDFINITHPNILSFDYYPFMSYKGHLENNPAETWVTYFFYCMESMSRKAKENNLPFIYVLTPTMQWSKKNVKTIPEFNYVINASLIYGAKGIHYWSAGHFYKSWEIISDETKQYLRELHKKLLDHEDILLNLTFQSAYHKSFISTINSPYSENFHPYSAWEKFQYDLYADMIFDVNNPIEALPNSSVDSIAISFLTDTSNNCYFWIFNKSICSSEDIQMHLRKKYELHDVLNDNILCSNYAQYVSLEPGEAKLFKVLTDENTMVINKTKSWDHKKIIDEDVIISPQAILIITDSIFFVPSASITVSPGGKLIIDGGKLTNTCGDFWQGIIVLGDSAQGQLDSKQGVIELKNGAVIENALTGVLVGSPENENSKNGGIIRANNANFINCPTGVVIKPYMRILQYGDERGNLSSFTSCTFIWNKEMNNVQNGLRPKPLSHVVLTETGNISFKGCHFINQRFSDRVTHGIYATDAKFEVNAIVAPNVYPPEIVERSSFDTLIYGIRTEKTIPSINRFATVKYTDFNNNTIGILNNGVNNSVFHNNTFKIGNPPGIIFAPNDPYTYKEEQHAKSLVPIFNFEFGTGITLNQSTGYDVRFNDFNRVQTPVYIPIGILVKNSGQAPNEIKNNTFDSLHIAILCNGNNKSTIAPYAGLQLLCNVFGDQTEYAIQIDNTGNGIAQYQGQNTRSAGNSFQQNNPKEFGHILNQSGDLTGYFYNIGHTASVPAKISSDIALFPITTSNSCLSSSSQEYSHEKLAMAKSIFASIKYNYNNLIDGGSTDQLLTELELSWSKDAWQVRDELIQKSPYLSETVIREVAAKDILPHAMLLEVCIANPDATRDRKFIHFLRYEIPNPIPEYMCDLIIANQDAKTFRTALEASLTAAESNLEIISRNILAQYFEDTLGNAIDSAIYILEHIPNIEASLELADLYAFSGDFSKALDLLEALEEDILKEQEVAELNTLELWYTIMDDWLLNNRTSLTENELQMMIELFLDNENKVSERTKSIFYQHSACDYNYHIEPNIPNSGKPKIMKQNVNAAVSDRNKVTVQPNPAGSFTTFNYELQPDANDAALLITDSKGVSLLSVSLADAKGHYLWDTRGISSGVYLYTVMYNGQILNSGKVVVKK